MTEPEQKSLHTDEADFELVDKSYFQDRQLGRGTIGWVGLAGLGVAYVIAGEFAAWNYGIGLAGWGGMIIALMIMAVMYFCLVFSLAELATVIPTAGGGYGFARRAFGPTLGFLTGMAIVFEYTMITAGIALFFEAYFSALTGIGGLPVLLGLFAIFLGIHVVGARESISLTLILAIISGLGILVFVLAMLPGFASANLFDVPVDATKSGASSLLPQGWAGIWAGLPFAMAMFLAVEGVPLAAEETRDPKTDLPKGMITAIAALFVVAVLVLVFGPGGAGAAGLTDANDPLMVALGQLYADNHPARVAVNIAGLIGIAASFFSVIFAYSRQVFSLSRAGYLPRFLSVTNRRKGPYMAVLIPGACAFALSLTGAADQIIVIGIFCATLSYLLMMAAHFHLRVKEPDLARPYRTPGGRATSAVAFVLSFLAALVCLDMNVRWSLYALGLLAVFLGYFYFYSRHHLIAQAPEEEFDTIRDAEAELAGAGVTEPEHGRG